MTNQPKTVIFAIKWRKLFLIITCDMRYQIYQTPNPQKLETPTIKPDVS